MSHPDARKIVASKLTELGAQPARKGSDGGSAQLRERTLRKWQDDIGLNQTAKTMLDGLEAGLLKKVLELSGLPALPTGLTADALLLEQIGVADLKRAHLEELERLVTLTRIHETT